MTMVLGIAGSSFGQGYAIFGTSGKSWVWDNFSTAGTSQVGGTASANIDIAFLIGSTANTPLLGTVGNPSGNTTSFNMSQGTTIWNDILNDPNFSLAQNLGTSSLAITPVNTSALVRGGWSYLGGASFQVANHAGGTYSIVAIAWDAAYSTPQLAAAADAAVGWSSVFSYALQPDTSTAPGTFNGAGMTPFGVTSIATVPEPTALALAGLGGLSLLLGRRKK